MVRARKFLRDGARYGQTLSRCQETKAEITWAKLLAGDEGTLLWNAVSDRERRPADDNTIVAAMLRMFWQHHAHALNLAEGEGLVRLRSGQTVPRSGCHGAADRR